MWYATMERTRDENIQRLGLVFLTYLLDDYPMGGMDMEFLRLGVKWRDVLPALLQSRYRYERRIAQ